MNTDANILGNGPSLKNIDINQFKETHSFFMNASYRFYERLGWYPQYYSCLDLVVGLSHKDAIHSMIKNHEAFGIKAFLLRQNLLNEIGVEHDGIVIFNFDLITNTVLGMNSNPITTGSHTLAWAVSLGFRDIKLYGIDLNYQEELPGQERTGTDYELLKTDNSANPNYFFDDYQQEGDKFNVPNAFPNVHINSWNNVAKVLKAIPDLRVVNASPVSALTCFPPSTS